MASAALLTVALTGCIPGELEPDAATPDASDERDGSVELACNGAPTLCDRRYNEVAYVTTHNAMSASAEGFTASDQRYGIARQLQDGVRAMMIDVWYHKAAGDDATQLYMCHGGSCASGKRKLEDGLADIVAFLEANPSDVLTIIFEDHVPGADLFAALASAGLDKQLYAQAPGSVWPTLRELVARDQRLVVFAENQGGTSSPPSGYEEIFDHAWDTTWENTAPAQLVNDCKLYRGQAANPLFILNHFLVTADRAEEFATEINVSSFLLPRAQKCQTESGSIPNFVTVDFYDVGDVFAAVRALNGL